MWTNLILNYMFWGVVNLAIIDYINGKMTDYNNELERFNNTERIVFFLTWPIPTFIFWFEFFRSFFSKD